MEDERIIIAAPASTEIAAVPEAPATPKPFRGYTLDELRYRRALAALKSEFAKEQALQEVNRLRHPRFINHDAGKGRFSSTLSLVGKLTKGLSYLDYVSMGISVIGFLGKARKLFRRKK